MELLKDLGFISKETLEKALTEIEKRPKSLMQILKKDVSIDALKELMSYEVPIPFAGTKRRELNELLQEIGLLSDEEIKVALQKGEQSDKEFGELLVEKGFISEYQLHYAMDESKRTGHPLWRTLINLKYVPPSKIAELYRYSLQTRASEEQDSAFADILLQTKVITKRQRTAAEKFAKGKKGTRIKYLIDKGIINPDEIPSMMEKYMNIPFVSIVIEDLDPAAVYSIPETIAREHKVIPISKNAGIIKLAMADPFKDKVINDIAFSTGAEIKPCLANDEYIEATIEHFFSEEMMKKAIPQEQVAYEGIEQAVESTEEPQEPKVGYQPVTAIETSAVNLVVSIIEGGINARATDIHFEPQEKGLRIRYRIDGVLYDAMEVPDYQTSAVLSRIKVLADLNITEKRRPQDGHLSLDVGEDKFNLRVATLPTYMGEKLVLRILKEGGVLTGIKQLGLSKDSYHTLMGLISKPNGMILVTGPIGSGKTTTLYACLNELDILHTNIVTIEDPVEYRIPGITQVQVNPEIDLDFPQGLKAILRQDADVIMIGEIRTPETAMVGVWAALTGQLVFSTLHTSNAIGAITMLSNLKIERYLIANSVIGVVAQRLVRRICPNCKETYKPEPALLKGLGLDEKSDLELARGAGCSACFYTGFQGRTGLFEILVINEEFRKLILANASEEEFNKAAIDGGMITLKDDGLRKIIEHITTPEEVLKEIIL